jgi:uncharacterized protein
VESAGRSGVGTMGSEELALADRVREQYQALAAGAIPCTRCQYSIVARWTERRCLPCPRGVAIPNVFEICNDLLMYGDNGRAKLFYSWIEEEKRAQACIECGECLRSLKGRLRFCSNFCPCSLMPFMVECEQ